MLFIPLNATCSARNLLFVWRSLLPATLKMEAAGLCDVSRVNGNKHQTSALFVVTVNVV
jgi:hypothetical protein